MSPDWHGNDFFGGVRARVAGGVGEAAQSLAGKMKALIATQGPPRSKPGEPPRIDTGKLIASVRATGPAESGDYAIAAAGTDVPYGVSLEFGTGKMAPRPWMSRAMRENQAELGQRIVKAAKE